MISSLVSFARRDIHETIPGMVISDYSLPSNKEGTILHVEDSFYYKPDIDGNQDRVAVNSQQIVESIVHMHITSQLAWKSDQYPALFAIPNVIATPESLKKDYKELVDKSLSAQRRWFIALVKIADDDWQQLRKHNMISDIQRTAAKELGLKREWLLAIEDEATSGCPFCGSNLLNPEAPICPTCGKIHNPAKLKALEAKLSMMSEPKKVQ